MRLFVLAGLLCLPLLRAEDRRVPVIVELFTSEGCSSCPPADGLLARMERTQPVAGARVIALEEHVDYWNQLGWSDPFSSAQYRARQNDYALTFRTEDIYTPQMIVSGQAAFVGVDADKAYQQIGLAAQAQTTVIDLKTSPNEGGPDLVDLSVRVSNPKNAKLRDANLYLAVTESELSTNVARGENAGRTLAHRNVVKQLVRLGSWDGAAERLPLPPAGGLARAVLVQKRGEGPILAAARG